MDLKNTSTILKKINRLYELISDIGEASSTETDLLKAYVLDLYEAVSMSDIEVSTEKDDEEMMKQLKKQKKLEKKLRKSILKNALVAQSDSNGEYDEEDTVEESHTNGVDTVVEAKPTEAPKVATDPALLSLFDMEKGHDLSEKLSLSPIKDLTKAMGINEKIFTINELFGGHQEEFDNLMVALNGLNSFEEAKSVLIRSVAPKYGWQKDENLKKAKHFVRLVHRRFN